MEKITGDEPAFPFWATNECGYGDAQVTYDRDGYKSVLNFSPGLTIRQYLAAKAMQGMLADSTINLARVAKLAAQQADMLISALNNTENPNK